MVAQPPLTRRCRRRESAFSGKKRGGGGETRFGRPRRKPSGAISGVFRRQTSAQWRVSIFFFFTTNSGRFASYVTNGLGERREGERDLLNEREEKSSGAFTSHGRLRFRVRTPKRNTNTNLGRYCGRLLLSAEASSQTGDAESPQVGPTSFYFTLLLLLSFFSPPLNMSVVYREAASWSCRDASCGWFV